MFNRIKKLCAVTAAAALSVNVCVFAKITEENGTYREDFEEYTTVAGMLENNLILQKYTNKAPELVEKNGSQAMAVVSDSNSDSILLTHEEIYTGEVNTISFKVSADRATNASWGAASAVLFRYMSTNGGKVNETLFDFAYNFIRHRINGAAKKLCDFSSDKVYEVSIKAIKVYRNEKYYFDVTYTVDGDSFTKSFETRADGTMCVCFKSVTANAVYIDDIELSCKNIVKSTLKQTQRNDVAVNDKLTVSFSGEIDETTIESGLTLNGQPINAYESLGNNSYLIDCSMQKNTTYTLAVNGVFDAEGNPVESAEFKFKTKNTDAVIVDGYLKNMSIEDTENVVKVSADYEQGKMQNASIETVELGPWSSIPLDTEKINTVMTADYRPIDTDSFCDNTGLKNETFSVSFDEQTQKLTVSGKTEKGLEDEYTLVAVFDQNGAADYIQTVKTGEGGYFSIECVPSGASGTYHVDVKTLDESFGADVAVRSLSDINAILGIVNGSDTTVEQLTRALTDYEIALAIQMDLYNALEDKSNISKGILKIVEESGKYTKVNLLAEDIQRLTVMETMNSAEEPYEIFKQYISLMLSEQDALYQLWVEGDEEIQSRALQYTIESSELTPESFKNQLYSQMLLTIIGQSNKYAEVKEIIENYPQWLGISLTAYNAAGKPASVAKGLYGAYRSPEKFVSAFNLLVQQAVDADNKLHSSGSSGSSGSGGGGGGIIAASPKNTAAPLPIPTTEPEQTEDPVSSEIRVSEFKDMTGSEWAEEAVYALCERNVINGYGDNTFRPNNQITREEFIVMAVRCAAPDKEAECRFTDVDANAWYYPYLSKAFAAGWINGMDDGSFGIGRNISRQDAAVILANLISDDAKTGDKVTYSDESSIADYAAEAVEKLSRAKVIDGNPDGSFNPNGFLTRAQAAKMLYVISK